MYVPIMRTFLYLRYLSRGPSCIWGTCPKDLPWVRNPKDPKPFFPYSHSHWSKKFTNGSSSPTWLLTFWSWILWQNESWGKDVKVLTYGVTFPLQGSDTALPVLDSLLEHYSQFSSPTVIHEDKEKGERMEKNPEEGLHIASRSMNIPTDGKPNDYNGMVIPPQQVTRKGKKVCPQ